MKRALKFFVVFLLTSYVVSSCKKDNENPEENDNEVITTVEVHFTEQGTSNHLVYKFDDADGPGGNAPAKDIITLSANKTYSVELVVLDKTKNPVATISDEIEEEADVHRFYFEPSAGSNIIVSNPDNDGNGIPVGLNTTWTTTGPSVGKIKITLRHYPSGGKALADLVNSSKSTTDAEVEFDTKVQ